MLQMNGIEAWISGDDKKPFPVYGVEKDPNTGLISCWIPFEPGANFAIRWRDMDDMLDLDLGGFLNMDGHQCGGRLIRSKSYAPAVFSRIPTSATQSRPLAFPLHSHDVPSRSPFGGTIVLDVHIVTSGDTRIHEGLSDHTARRIRCCSQGPLLSSLLPSSSTEVASMGKLATFVFRYRTMNFLRAYGIAPIDAKYLAQQEQDYDSTYPRIGEKRSATLMSPDDLDDSASWSSSSSSASSPSGYDFPGRPEPPFYSYPNSNYQHYKHQHQLRELPSLPISASTHLLETYAPSPTQSNKRPRV